MTKRLSKIAWIDHGLTTLAHSGVSSLKVGAMASALKVSRGSFYWHFTDIADFRAQLLQGWQNRMTDQIILDINEDADSNRLKHLMLRALTQADDLDSAIRLWATLDSAVAAIVAQVDSTRTAYIEALLIASGVSQQNAQDRARFIYLSYLGRSLIMSADGGAISDAGIKEVADLLQRG